MWTRDGDLLAGLDPEELEELALRVLGSEAAAPACGPEPAARADAVVAAERLVECLLTDPDLRRELTRAFRGG